MSDLMKLLRRAKLGTCLHQVQHRVSKEEIQTMPFDVEEVVKKEMIQKMASGVINTYKDLIECQDEALFKQYKLSLMVMTSSDFKFMIEAAIQEMDMKTIEKIRAGETMIQKLLNTKEE